MRRPNRGIIQPRRDRIDLGGLARSVGEQITSEPVENAGLTHREGRRVAAVREAASRGFHSYKAHILIADKGREGADSVAAAADTGDDGVRQAAFALKHLRAGLVADYALKILHHRRVRVGPDRRANEIKERGVGAERGKRGVYRLLKRFLAILHRHHVRAKRLHTQHIRRLARDIHRSHIDVAFHAHQGGDGRCGDAVHPRPRLRDEPLLAHAFSKQGLPDAVIYLMRSRVIQVLAFEEDTHASRLFREVKAFGKRRGAADIFFQQAQVLLFEGAVSAASLIFARDLRHHRLQLPGNIRAAETSIHRAVGKTRHYLFSHDKTPPDLLLSDFSSL